MARRILPLSGLVAVALVLTAFLPLNGNSPDTDASAQKVASFYLAHHGRETAGAFVVAAAALFLVLFGAGLYRALRGPEDGGSAPWALVFFGGSVIAAVGFLAAAAIRLALVDGVHDHASIVATQAVNVLDSDDFLTFSLGTGIMVLGAGAALVTRRDAFRWLGWAGLAIGILDFTPLGFFAFGAAGAWVVVASIAFAAAERPASDRARIEAQPSAV
jgi:hypothetical protein